MKFWIQIESKSEQEENFFLEQKTKLTINKKTQIKS